MVMLINKGGSLVGEFEGEDALFRYLQAIVNASGGEEAQRWQLGTSSNPHFMDIPVKSKFG
jgi:hypothetical protein